MEQADATDHDAGVAAINTCMDRLEADSKPAFSAVPNAFFSPAGPITSLLGFENGGIFFFQGPSADFAYDGDIIYHEFGHNIVSQIGNNILTGGNLLDPNGLDDSPGALNEAYADYFAGIISEDPVVGGYAGTKTGMGEGIRRMDHELACPDFWAGEVHADSWGWAGALWAARALYPQRDVHPLTELPISIFDRAVLDGLKTLTTNSTYGDAAEATINAIKREPLLDDPDAEQITQVFESRNIIDCKRIRPLTTTTPIKELFVAAAATGSGGIQDLVFGGQSFTPYAPPAVQFKVDIASLSTQSPTRCATFEASLPQPAGSAEGLDLPDVLSGEEEPPQSHQLKLLYSTQGPIEFEYSGNVNVTSPHDENVIELSTTLSGDKLTGSLYFHKDTTEIHYALVNEGPTSPLLGDIKLVNINQGCVDPNAPPTIDDEPIDGTPNTSSETTGCDCHGTPSSSPVSLLLLLLGGFFIRRQRLA